MVYKNPNYQKEYCENHREKIREYKRKHYNSHKKEKREYANNHKEKIGEYQKEYRDNHKEELRKYHKNRRIEIRNIINSYRDKPCKICNKTYPVFCMDFHHITPKNKIDQITYMIYCPKKYTIEDIINEIKKCIVICANCHTIIGNNNYKRYQLWFLELRSKLKCEKCGIDKPLEFHHIDKSIKINDIIWMLLRPKKYSKDDILKEIEKCQVLCTCCHRITEFEER